MDIASRTRVAIGLLMLAALAVLGVLSVNAVTASAPLGADAPADEFSATRAFTHVQRAGLEVHPVGSAAAIQVRDYIVDTRDGLGLDGQTREGIGATDELGGPFGMADTRNVVVRLPGTAPTGTLILMAHYDSVQVSHGGNDDGAGVSTLLEIARAMTAGPPPANDVVFLFTDADPGAWVGQYVTEPGTADDTFGLVGGSVTVGPAAAADLPAPQVTVVADTTNGETRTLTLRVSPQRQARLIYLAMSDTPVLAASFQGREVPAEVLVDGLSVVFHAPPPGVCRSPWSWARPIR